MRKSEDGTSVETNLIAIGDENLDDLVPRIVAEPAVMEALCTEVARPRFNIGNSGPPGRAD